ncbi:MAG TPA: DNA polymerase III subunit delta [Solirubrobacterales bacterium]|nr:DNA polymerase III subunit delta [Solirubrobacterales bacterium]
MAEIKALYLIAGTDQAKIDATRLRLRSRAEEEGGPTALEVFEPTEGKGSPDHKALLAAIPTLSLAGSRRYLLADGVERWRESQLEEVATALGSLPPELTVVLVARAKAPPKLLRAVEGARGQIHQFEAPAARDMPNVLVADAKRMGLELQPTAARMLVERMGPNPVRLQRELERLTLWAGEGKKVTERDLEAMVADTSEAAVWSLSDALLDRDPAQALALGERLMSQGENVTGLIYALVGALRRARSALAMLEEGMPPKQVETKLGIHPYAARQLLGRLHGRSLDELREATEVLADLEVWCRGGAEYGDQLALVLALRRAAGVAA